MTRRRQRRAGRHGASGLPAALALAAIALLPAAAAAGGTPGPVPAAAPSPAREVIFLIDASAAIDGEALERTREALAAALGRLRPGDTFNVVAAGEPIRALFPFSLPALPESRARAARWVGRLEAAGAVVPPETLAAALGRPDEGYAGPGRVRQVVLLDGGAPASDPGGDRPAAVLPVGEPVALAGVLGGGLLLFAAALAHALRRGLAAPEPPRRVPAPAGRR